MAPVLQCPDCGEKHPLATVPGQGAFKCRGCGRVLKVPEVVGQRAAAARPVPVASAVASASAPPVVPAGPPTTVLGPEVDGKKLGALAPLASRRPAGQLGSVPWWMRLLLWMVAVPLAFLIVFLLARAFSLFTTNELSDVFLASDTARFWPVARLLPFVALFTAGLVQGGVYLLARLRGRRGRAKPPPLGPRQRGSR